MDPTSVPASAAPAVLCCLNKPRQSRGKKRQLRAQVINVSGSKKKEYAGWMLTGTTEQKEWKKWKRISGKSMEKKK